MVVSHMKLVQILATHTSMCIPSSYCLFGLSLRPLRRVSENCVPTETIFRESGILLVHDSLTLKFSNDHHFHYGYFIYTAAVIAYLDPSWLPLNQAWVNSLVRDAANPSTQDNMFAFSRMFDWYHGHSFAAGLFELWDGKDEESSSEDAFFAYAMKMWGRVISDSSMEARGNLMLSILARSFDEYFLLSSNNKNQPANFIANKVTGIASPPLPSKPPIESH